MSFLSNGLGSAGVGETFAQSIFESVAPPGAGVNVTLSDETGLSLNSTGVAPDEQLPLAMTEARADLDPLTALVTFAEGHPPVWMLAPHRERALVETSRVTLGTA